MGCCEWLVKPLLDGGIPKQSIDVYKIGKIYDYKAFKVAPVKLYHDVPNNGYRLYIDEKKVLYVTDTGHLQGITAKNYTLYLLESNFEEEELEKRIIEKTATGQYVYEFRTAKYHLSHEQASEFLLRNMGKHSNYVFLHQHKEKKSKKSREWEYQDE